MNIMYRIVVSPWSSRWSSWIGEARRALTERNDARPAVGDVADDRADDCREERGSDPHAERGEYGRSDHDDEQAQGGEGGETSLDAEEAGEDQAEGAGDLADADEVDEGDGQRDRTLHLVGGHDELHGAGEGKEERDDDLSGPQQAVGGSLGADGHWSSLV
jgi:hypothetical protein